jgi:hypothetical protein
MPLGCLKILHSKIFVYALLRKVSLKNHRDFSSSKKNPNKSRILKNTKKAVKLPIKIKMSKTPDFYGPQNKRRNYEGRILIFFPIIKKNSRWYFWKLINIQVQCLSISLFFNFFWRKSTDLCKFVSKFKFLSIGFLLIYGKPVICISGSLNFVGSFFLGIFRNLRMVGNYIKIFIFLTFKFKIQSTNQHSNPQFRKKVVRQKNHNPKSFLKFKLYFWQTQKYSTPEGNLIIPNDLEIC